jgi:hypothetical protein
MQATVDLAPLVTPMVSQADAQRAVSNYVVAHLDPAFEVIGDARYYHKTLGREVWQFMIRCAHGPLDAILVEAQTGAVIPRTREEIRVIREKAALLAARKQGVLPLNEQGYVLAEYARRRVRSYLDEHLSMFYDSADPVFVPGDPSVWQVSIVFHMYSIGPFMLGVMDVDAHTGEPIPLTTEQLQCIQERACAIVRHQTPTTTSG